ncbi:hypothetical protein Hypma_009844 [Hypsizygus marmoreus]|uniref:Uncharacterized protein n=1 Tax=Hypsizygus marmoreus TaxID=39966 RepID=A0A369JRC5_HYPMA|nr:hypothetical protein Hypma_009844 [Hypsizygus marmoreus]
MLTISSNKGLALILSSQPLQYGFESIMANEFHTLNILLKPRVILDGAVARQDFVNGKSQFILLSYDYWYSNVWRKSESSSSPLTTPPDGSCRQHSAYIGHHSNVI